LTSSGQFVARLLPQIVNFLQTFWEVCHGFTDRAISWLFTEIRDVWLKTGARALPRIKPMKTELRTETRERIALPVQAGGQAGLTRDISATGLYFMTDSALRVGSAIELEIELSLATGNVRLKGQGQVVRIEPQGQQTGVAVRMTESRLVPGGKG